MKQHFLFKHLSAQKLHYFSFLLFSILGGLLLTRNYAAGYICTRSGSYFFTFLGYLLCLFLFSHALKVGNAGHSSYSRCRCVLYFSVLPFLAFFMEELLWNESFFAISGKSLLINYLVEYLFLLSLFLLIRSFHSTFVLFLSLNWIYGMANHYVLEFKGCPPLFSDLLASQTAITVLGNYSYALDDAIVTGTFLFLYTWIFLLYFPLTPKTEDSKTKNASEGNRASFLARHKLLVRVLGILCSFLWIPCLFFLDISDFSGITINGWSPVYSFTQNGAPITLLISVQNVMPSKPAHYSREAALAAISLAVSEAKEATSDGMISNEVAASEGAISAGIVSQETSFSGLVSEGTVSEDASKNAPPSVIVIMNESFADLSVLGDFVSDDYLASFYDIDDYLLRGMVYPSVCGGGTCNSEFEFLTGSSMANVKPGIYPYQNYDLSNASNLVQVFNNLGYQTVAFHPYQAENWNRTNVYNSFGFQEFLSQEDMTDKEILSWTISDHSDFEKIKEIYENRTAPLFLFNVTMQNHGGYNVPIRSDVELVSIEKQYSGYSDVINYLTLIRESADAFKELLNYFAAQPDPVIICMFGDHQPILDGDFLSSITQTVSDEEHSILAAEQRYITPYIIWSNYDVSSTLDTENTEQTDMSLNYLGANRLELLGVSTPYSQYLLSLQKQIPIVNSVGYQNSLGGWFSLEIENPALTEYQSVQYYELFGQ